jgi:WD40 repeat protein
LYKTRSDLTQAVEKIAEFDSAITGAVITGDRNALIFSCGNAVKVLNTRTDHIIQELVTSPAMVERLALTDNRLVSWSSDGTMIFRDYNLNQLTVDPFLWFRTGTTGNLAFSHDGTLMVTGNTGTWARIWKPVERNVVQELFGHADVVTNFVFSADDQTLFTAAQDKTIKEWKKNLSPLVPVKTEVASPLTTTDSIQPAVFADTTSLSMPAIELNKENIPSHVGGRKVEKTSVVEVSDSSLELFVFDISTLDGDIISLSFQNQWILAHYEVTKQKKKITIHLQPGSNNYLVLFADNLGKTPPNTAAISFDSKGQERIFRLESDLKTCSSINFIYRAR